MLKEIHVKAILDGSVEGVLLKTLGLRGRGEVFIIQGVCVRVINRSSRFLRKDADAFLEILKAVQQKNADPIDGQVIIQRAPVCSKARAWLETHGVAVLSLAELT